MMADWPDEVLAQPQPRRKRRWLGLLTVAFGAFLLGGSVVGWLAWHGRFPPADVALPFLGTNIRIAGTPATPAAPQVSADTLARNEGAMAARLAALQQQLDRIDAQANTKEADTARAEALLIAFAARRAIERGAPLGYLEDQVKLRFGAALPDATATVIAAGRDPVTLDQLVARLQAMGPTLTASPQTGTMWDRLRSEVDDLFVLRRETKSAPPLAARFDHALFALREGRVGDAVADVQRLSNAGAAQDWIVAARRYMQTEQALDQLETTALVEPSDLRDGAGHLVHAPDPDTPPDASDGQASS